MRVAVLWAGLLFFLLSSLIAPGIMPARAVTSAVVFVICMDNGAAEMAFDPVTMEPVSDRKEDGKDTPRTGYCPWAVSHSADSLMPPPTVVPPPVFARRLASSIIDTVLAISQATGLPPSTGPPSAV